ncbi:MAG: rod shape-determining protein MreC [Lachnospiraceae bacterium]|nr:rod shape-determining protein MreC [Lachnospiraceae bacterium]
MCPVVKKKEEKKKIPGKYVLLIFTVLCVALMLFTFNHEMQGGFLQNAAGFIFVPFQKGIAKVSSNLVEFVEEKHTIAELNAENEKLRRQIDELNWENAQLMQDHYELTNLRELYELDSTYAEYDKVGARIIAAGNDNRFNSFLIDKGSDDGIAVNMNVLAGSGLVGIVSETGKNWSRVTTIISDNSNVSGTVLHTQDNLIVSGSMELIGQGMITYSQLVDRDRLVVAGDKVVTSNISDRYLPGILIGYITTVEEDSNHLTLSGKLTPVVDFEHLSDVLVITETKKMVEE